MAVLRSSATFARPADTAAYAALDAVANSTNAPTVVTVAGGSPYTSEYGFIVKAQLHTDQKSCVARIRAHLFNAAPTAINDNSPYLKLFASAASYIGSVDFPALSTEDPTNSTGATAIATPGNGNLALPFTLGADSTFYYLLETLDAFTPANGQNFTLILSLLVS